MGRTAPRGDGYGYGVLREKTLQYTTIAQDGMKQDVTHILHPIHVTYCGVNVTHILYLRLHTMKYNIHNIFIVPHRCNIGVNIHIVP